MTDEQKQQELAELYAFLEVNFGPPGSDTRVTLAKYAQDHIARPSPDVLAASCLTSDRLMDIAQISMQNPDRLPRYQCLLRLVKAMAAIGMRIERLEATEQ